MEGWKKLRETDWWEQRTQMRRRKANTKHKYKIHMVKTQTTKYKIHSQRMWRRREGRGGEGGGEGGDIVVQLINTMLNVEKEKGR